MFGNRLSVVKRRSRTATPLLARLAETGFAETEAVGALLACVLSDPELDAQVMTYNTGRVSKARERATLQNEIVEPFLREYFKTSRRVVWDSQASKHVVGQLLNFLQSSTVGTVRLHPLSGVAGNVRSFELDDGVTVDRLNMERKRALFEQYCDTSPGYPGPFAIWDLDQWQYLLRIEYEVDKRALRDLRSADGSSQLDAWQRSRDALAAFRLWKAGHVAYRCWFEQRRQPYFGLQHGMSAAIGARTRGSRGYELHTGDIPEIRRLYGLLRSRKRDDRLELALRRLEMTYDRADPVDELLDSWIGLEALFLPDGNQELSYRIALRGARLLGDTHAERLDYFNQMRRAYQQRSNLVHGSPVKDVETEASAAAQIVREAIRRWIDPAFPNDVGSLDEQLLQ
jgi:hypothetical protein